jgi:tetratricopeptide (TPR) repeat protein
VTVTRIVPANLGHYGAIALLLAASITLQVVRDRGWQPLTPPGSVMWIRSGELARRLSLGFDSLVADVYWIRAVVYFGGQRTTTEPTQFEQLFPLLDLVTSLDPQFNVAYRFGAIFLAEPLPGGAGRPDLAIELLQKGIKLNPKRWEYLQDIGFIHYFWSRDYARAADWFKRAETIEGAPEWLGPLAATTLAEGGNRQSSRTLWTELRKNTDLEWIRTMADRRLQQLDALDAIDELNRATARFVARTGRAPFHWQEVAAAEGWRQLPTDPTGTLFALDQTTGSVSLSEGSTLWPLPVGPGAAQRR